jgi:hypothetical protein
MDISEPCDSPEIYTGQISKLCAALNVEVEGGAWMMMALSCQPIKTNRRVNNEAWVAGEEYRD